MLESSDLGGICWIFLPKESFTGSHDLSPSFPLGFASVWSAIVAFSILSALKIRNSSLSPSMHCSPVDKFDAGVLLSFPLSEIGGGGGGGGGRIPPRPAPAVSAEAPNM